MIPSLRFSSLYHGCLSVLKPWVNTRAHHARPLSAATANTPHTRTRHATSKMLYHELSKRRVICRSCSNNTLYASPKRGGLSSKTRWPLVRSPPNRGSRPKRGCLIRTAARGAVTSEWRGEPLFRIQQSPSHNSVRVVSLHCWHVFMSDLPFLNRLRIERAGIDWKI